MNSKNVHIGLEDQALREYFAEHMILAEKTINSTKKRSAIYDKDDPIAYSIETCDIEIEYTQRKRKGYQYLQSVMRLMGEREWSEWDVSDYTNTYQGDWYSFIGTKKEYDQVISQLIIAGDEKDS